MRKYLTIFIFSLLFLGYYRTEALEAKGIVDSLTTIDPEIRKYFPRWKICETDLQIQIHQAFRIEGFDAKDLNMGKIEVLAAPRKDPFAPYDILLLTCGTASMTSADIDAHLPALAGIISGDYSFKTNMKADEPKRDYCFTDIPPEVPVSNSEAAAIVSYLEPTNVTHAFTLSLFEQSLKIGETGFWIRNFVGTDQVGYPFWESGEAKVVLKRPLYINQDSKTRDRIPFLINAYMGAGYRLTSGNDNHGTIFNWVPGRKLNAGPGGKLIGGFDFNMPFAPEAGLSLNLELPIQELRDYPIDVNAYSFYNNVPPEVIFDPNDPNAVSGVNNIAAILRATGQATIFYNWWLDEANPENYIRFDIGISYAEVRELGAYTDSAHVTHLTQSGIYGLQTYKPNTFGDWVFAKLEYRNQAAFPFGFSLQYSNQILLSRVYVPLLGNWLYLEGKYATPLRGLRPYEVKNFFMISPVLRITI